MWKFSCILAIFATLASTADYVQAQKESTANQPDDTPVKAAEPGICFNWQGNHYKTFDGRIYSFSSKCGFILVRGTVDNFNVVVQDHPQCVITPSNCSKIIKVHYGGEIYILKQSEEDGMAVFMSTKGRLPIPGQVDEGVRIGTSAQFYILSLDTVGLTVKWDGKQMIQVEAEKSLWGRTQGLCGKLDGVVSNDMVDEEGNTYERGTDLAPHWQSDDMEKCKDPPKNVNPCEQSVKSQKTINATIFCDDLLHRSAFNPCKGLIDSYPIEGICRKEYCSCTNKNPEVCACETISIFVRACTFQNRKLVIDWRNKDTCPMACPNGRVYKPCGPDSGQPLCGSAVEKSGKYGCVEGCYCPDGAVLHENKCITRDKCPCILDGKTYQPGSKVPKECNTCTCKNGMWDCTNRNCNSTCNIVGDPHYKTFDGKYYDFMGKCTYYLVKTDTFSIEHETAACIGYTFTVNLAPEATKHLASCTKSVTVRYSGHTINLKQNRKIVLDGEEVTDFPYQISNITIRHPSSSFVQVDLPNGIHIKWNGKTNAFIHIPGWFKEKTKGLCGTFNFNPKDDFLTPEGDVEENINSFGNKWKTNESCDDTPVTPDANKHACDVHKEKKSTAEKHCKIIKSNLFSPCHKVVDPEPHYQNCLYDMCSCGNNPVSKCLCETIAAYADECVGNGVKIDWRDKVKECSVVCPSGQKYQVCGNSCARTCKDVAISPNCKSKCVEGCNCPPGETLNEESKCIPIPKCKCEYEGISFDPGYKAKKGGQLCTCTNATWICRPATPSDNDKYPDLDPNTGCNTTKHMIYTKCAPAKPATCKNMEVPTQSLCKPGCICDNGYVLDTDTMKCVKPTECTCHHGGKSYKENATITTDCSTCICHHGKWICTDRPCSSKCMIWGDSHFKTFDGKHFDFQGQCEYMLSKGSLKDRSFEISIQNVQCSKPKTSCFKSITLRVKIGKDQEAITLTRDEPLPSVENLEHFSLREVGPLVVVEAPQLGLVIQWDKGTRVYVRADSRWRSKTMGLCGNYNDNEADDFQTPSGGIPEVLANIFADSWKLQTDCPESTEITNTCEKNPDRKMWAKKKCEILLSKVFAPCHTEVLVGVYLEKCILDACTCDQNGDCEGLCTALATYAQECNNRGVPIKWRSKELCPMKCDKGGTIYNPCISTCPIQTCDSLAKDTAKSKTCHLESCIEGCAPKPCPPDHIYQNSSLLECIPLKNCKLFCLKIDGVVYSEGEVIEEDACHKCYCSQQKKQCNGSPCTPTTQRPPVTTPDPNKPTPKPDIICPEFDCGPGYEKILASTEKKKTALEMVLPRPPVTQPITEICPKYICKKIPTECEKVSCPPDYVLIILNPGCSRCPDSYYCNPLKATCKISSQTINTFDGSSFNIRICNHILAEDLEHKRWKIILIQKCSSCTKNIVIHHQDDTLEIHSTSTVEYNNFTYTTDQAKKIRSQSFSIAKTGNQLVFVSHRFGFRVHLNDQNDVKIDTILDLKEKVDGLCGYFNGNPSDDMRKPDGTLAPNSIEFGDSWQNGTFVPCENKTCPEELRKKALELCQIKNEILNPCTKVINRDAYVARCVDKTCDCLQKAGTDQDAREECRCNALANYVVECLTVEPSTDLLDWRALLNCPVTCKAPLVYHDCYQRRCEYTCDTIRNPKACPKIPNVCFPGCYCPTGFVKQGETCIKPTECRNCRCHVYPSLKYVTYDENRLVVNSNCVFVMSRDVLGNAEHKFQVLITHAPCKNKKSKTCLTKVTILYRAQKIHIVHDPAKNKLKLELEGDLAKISKWFLVEETVDKNYQIFLKDIYVDISIFYPGLGTTIKAPSAIYGGKLEGLCGNCDNDPKNDFTTPSGQLVKDRKEFALSWLYENQNKDQCMKNEEDNCTPPPNKKDPCELIQNPTIFGQCHQVLDPGLFLEWCRKDTCDNHPELACASIEAYAKGCASQGLCIDWRMNICPKICPPGTVYNPCGPSCPKTCDNIKGGGKPCPNKPFDGCFCPEGKVLLNNTCVEERKCIVCDDEGHHPGDKWRKDKCTTCSCEGTVVKCVRDKCPAAQTCKEGFRLVKKPPVNDDCCDTYECIQEACIVNGKPKYPNETWTSEDKCTTFTCEKHNNYFVLVKTREACPSVKNCPSENIYNDGCCKQCNMTTPSKKLCAVEEVPSEDTRYLITMEHQVYGQCENDDPIPNFKRCKGTCFSSSSIKSGTKIFENKCSCCKPTKTRQLVVKLGCTNGDIISEKVLVPTECGCREGCN